MPTNSTKPSLLSATLYPKLITNRACALGCTAVLIKAHHTTHAKMVSWSVCRLCYSMILLHAGRVYDTLRESCQPSRVSPPRCDVARDRPLLHCLVFCVSFWTHSTLRTCIALMIVLYGWAFSRRLPDYSSVVPLTDFIRFEVTSTKFSRHLVKELLISLWSALFMGFGSLFLLLWVGIYVW